MFGIFDWPRWIGIVLGLVVGGWFFVGAPMYANYQANGCVFLTCN